VLERHGPTLVTLMLAGYAASDAPCRPVMRELLDSDERFVIGPPIEIDERPSALLAPPRAVDKKELEAKRTQRKAAKDAKRAAEIHERDARSTAQARRRDAVHKSKRKGY